MDNDFQCELFLVGFALYLDHADKDMYVDKKWMN